MADCEGGIESDDWDRGIPTSYAWGGKNVFQYDREKGHLKVNKDFMPGMLEKIAEEGGIPSEGTTIRIALPLMSDAVLPCVKSVAYMDPAEEVYEDALVAPSREKGLFDRLKAYFGW